MARIFNIYFSFDGESHSSIVSVRATPFFTEYTLALDAHLLNQLPSNKIIATLDGDTHFQLKSSHCNERLMKAILQAVTHHLDVSQNVS